jgi:hypothetical protein
MSTVTGVMPLMSIAGTHATVANLAGPLSP